jgi:predicted HTH transcriptional regulator
VSPEEFAALAAAGESESLELLEIISTGDAHFGLTTEALFREHESRRRNPMIARAIYRRGIIETWGRGTLRIARLTREAGQEPPTVSLRPCAAVLTSSSNTSSKTLRSSRYARQSGADTGAARDSMRLQKETQG